MFKTISPHVYRLQVAPPSSPPKDQTDQLVRSSSPAVRLLSALRCALVPRQVEVPRPIVVEKCIEVPKIQDEGGGPRGTGEAPVRHRAPKKTVDIGHGKRFCQLVWVGTGGLVDLISSLHVKRVQEQDGASGSRDLRSPCPFRGSNPPAEYFPWVSNQRLMSIV